jgi:hypothetical protein
MLRKGRAVARSVMPVAGDVHGTGRAAFPANEAAADFRPGQVLRQGVQSDIDHAAITFAAGTLDIAGYVPVRDPFRRTARRVFVRPS